MIGGAFAVHMEAMNTAVIIPDDLGGTPRYDERWRVMFLQVVGYLKKHGTLPSVDSPDPGDAGMARWIRRQRDRHMAGLLEEQRRSLLDTALPNWLSSVEASWQKSFSKVLRFNEQHGGLPPNSRRSNAETLSLAVWVQRQRALLRDGKLRPERREMLDTALPGWDSTGRADKEWQTMFSRVLDYRDCYGCLPTVAAGIDPERRTLAGWVSGQRHRARNGRLEPHRLALLNKAFPGWNEDIASRFDQKWNDQLAAVADFKDRHGVIPRDDKLEANEHALRVWLSRQRRRHTDGTLTTEQLAALNGIDPDWLANGTKLLWEDRFTVARLHLGGAGSDDAEARTQAEKWLYRQFQRRHSLEDLQIAALDSEFPGWRNEDKTWDKVLDRIAANRAGGVRDGRRDADWLGRQRSAQRRGKLSEDRRRKLDERLSGWMQG